MIFGDKTYRGEYIISKQSVQSCAEQKDASGGNGQEVASASSCWLRGFVIFHRMQNWSSENKSH